MMDWLFWSDTWIGYGFFRRIIWVIIFNRVRIKPGMNCGFLYFDQCFWSLNSIVVVNVLLFPVHWWKKYDVIYLIALWNNVEYFIWVNAEAMPKTPTCTEKHSLNLFIYARQFFIFSFNVVFQIKNFNVFERRNERFYVHK